MDVRVISIGTMAAHPLWGERTAVRTGHSTTTLLSRGERHILVDPGLPASALAARLGERANLTPPDITDVFLTSFHPEVRRALTAFDSATWWIHEAEREHVGVALAQQLIALKNKGESDAELLAALESDVAILRRCKAAPEELAEHVALFPLPGVSPGCCGLLIEEVRHTTLICGDALPTVEHLDQGIVPGDAVDVTRARESFEEALEIADLLIPGRDNITVNRTKRPF